MNINRVIPQKEMPRFAETIKSLVPVYRAIELYVPGDKGVKRYGNEVLICCPFHREKTPSFRTKERFWKCFGCGDSGDVISFVSAYFGLDFKGAIEKLNCDFALYLPLPGSNVTIRQAHNAARLITAVERERAVEKSRMEELDRIYESLLTEWNRLDFNLRKYSPKTMEEFSDPHPLYVEACNKIDFQKYLLDCFVWE